MSNPPSSSPAAVGGMGAVLHDGGVAFRVWAPNARGVAVKGSFNDWSDDAHPLHDEGNGHWSTDVAGAKASDEYKFRIVGADGEAVDRIDPQARQVTNSVGTGVVVDRDSFDWQGDDYQLPGHHELVIYEMHIGSFKADDQDGPGDFASAASQFDHLQRLGVNVVQVMPVAEFAGDYSWGYNPAHLFAVESAYGGPDAFKTFVREAHKRGIGVVLDVVYNHFGPSDLDLWRFDGWGEGDKGGIYFYNDHKSATPWGDTRPDYGRGEVRQFIRDNALMWLDEFRVDGLRFDMTLYIRTIAGNGGDDIEEGWSLMRWVNEEVRERHPRAITIAEDLRQVDAMTASPDDGGAGFHAQWDARFVHPVREAVIVPDDAHRSMQAVCDAVMSVYNDDAFRRVVYSESHDEVANGKARVPQEIHPDDATGWHAQKRSALAAVLVFTSPGIPMIFQGQEFLQGEWFRDDVPLDWDQRDEFRGIVRLYRDLIRARRDHGGVTRGLCGHGCEMLHLDDGAKTIAYLRRDAGGPGDDVVVVLNFSTEPRDALTIPLPAPGRWFVRVNTDSSHYNPDFGDAGPAEFDAEAQEHDGRPARATLQLAPYAALVLSQARDAT